MSLSLGIDLGTSGCRATAIDADGTIHASAEVFFPTAPASHARHEQDPLLWWDATLKVLAEIARRITPNSIAALAIDGTSGTLLLTDASGRPLGPALMYDDARSLREAGIIAAIAPPECAAMGPTSALAKLLYLQARDLPPDARHALHQADWVAGRLAGRYGITDENNALKLGYDAIHRRWPSWLSHLDVRTDLLPDVVAPGTPIGTLDDPEARALGYPDHLRIVAGTTDSVAAFIATGAHAVGDAVTSLGSTLVLKLICDRPLFSQAHGIYSHRLGEHWLAGGGSNSGGAVLRHCFSIEEIDAMTPRLHPDHPTGLDYYPLIKPGERFPSNDPAMPPRLTPRPSDDVVFFQAMLEGIARIEALGYRRLEALGAPRPRKILTVGGGARNDAWTRIRQHVLQLPIERAEHDQACYGTALLASGAL
jgi:sugar (pentulose or hexulose) kinase